MTRGQIKDLVYDLLGEKTTDTGAASDFWNDAQLEQWIDQGQDWVYDNLPDEAKLSVTKRFTVATTTNTATYYYALDTGAHITDGDGSNAYTTQKTFYSKYLEVSWTPTGCTEYPMSYIPPDQSNATRSNAFFSATSTGNPIFTIVENKIRPWPQVTNTTCKINIKAIVRPRPLLDDKLDTPPFTLATSELAPEYHHIIAWFVVAMWRYRDDEIEAADRMLGVARDELARITADSTAARGVQQ